ncbi:MAG TPA: hypothetical protein VKG25_11360 [Bryobacteraceae bacterium]|nr:hypothetical protein [Bryobacteraceae bacterium]
MTLDQIDQLLAQWRGKLEAAAQNLVDLRSHPTYLELAGRSDLTGITLARVEPMLASMVNLFDYYDRLQARLARAEEARKEITRLFTSPEKIDQVQRILTKPPNGASETPDELLDKLNQGLSAAKEVVLNVDSAWRQLGSHLDAVERELQGLQSRIDAARQLIATDPLGAQAETAALSQLAARKMTLKLEMNNAAQTLAALGVAHDRANQSFTEASGKIQNAQLRQPCPAETISALDQWLKTLNAKMDQGAWDAVAIGIDRWKESAGRCLQSEMEAADANHQPVLLRRELRGRLDALKAKAVAKGKSEDADLSRLGKQARSMLQTNPTSIDQAEQIVREYEKRLSRLLCQ